MKNLRERLENNKVYFEVFSYLVLGAASIVVAFLSWQTSERQLELYELEKIPVIYTKIETEENQKVVNVYNLGQPAFDISVFPVAVIAIKNVRYSTPNGEDPSLFIHFSDFYESTSATSNLVGKIATLPINNVAWETIIEKKDSLTTEKNPHQGVILHHYQLLDLKFEDLQGGTHRKFYMIVHGSPLEINESRFNELLHLHGENTINLTTTEFEQMSLKEIGELVPMDNVRLREIYSTQE
ncbi:hypothetical protein [Salinimicrobium oceani]|uniref:Uncharacterized protein n=1 Tax=Salinimicrobium oceani TaxID=2722702 RepID=A0ABX1CU46_9FLAO|nr:hypothetical protein [Salinimicrobium oceani]NJW51813.1 hypothetical protein [Salinimicrobium oceani]